MTMQRVLEEAEVFKALIAKERDADATRTDPQSTPSKREQEITVGIRFRPVLPQELAKGNFGCAVKLSNDTILLHKPEFKLSREPVINTDKFTVDLAFGQDDSNEHVYSNSARDLIPLALGGGVGTLFAYGQTSSGKTHTLVGIQEHVARDVPIIPYALLPFSLVRYSTNL